MQLTLNVTQGIKMSRMSANYIAGKTTKYEESFFAHFQILMEMGKKYVFLPFLISHI